MSDDRDDGNSLSKEEADRLIFTACALHALIARSLNHNPQQLADTACSIGKATSERFSATAPGAPA
jgi:hypothetical protein